MEKKKKIALILAIFALIAFIGSVAYTYAKYFTLTTGKIGSSIKQWNIKVNDELIKNNTTLSQTITAYFPNENGKTAVNKMAPGTEGYFEIVIDYSKVDLSFSYDLSIAENEKLKDLQIDRIEVDGEEIERTDPDSINIVGNVNIEDPDDDLKKIVIVYFKWYDESDNIMDDEEDTSIPIENDSIDFDVNILVTQLNN